MRGCTVVLHTTGSNNKCVWYLPRTTKYGAHHASNHNLPESLLGRYCPTLYVAKKYASVRICMGRHRRGDVLCAYTPLSIISTVVVRHCSRVPYKKIAEVFHPLVKRYVPFSYTLLRFALFILPPSAPLRRKEGGYVLRRTIYSRSAGAWTALRLLAILCFELECINIYIYRSTRMY